MIHLSLNRHRLDKLTDLHINICNKNNNECCVSSMYDICFQTRIHPVNSQSVRTSSSAELEVLNVDLQCDVND